jgi:hypothetical protein
MLERGGKWKNEQTEADLNLERIQDVGKAHTAALGEKAEREILIAELKKDWMKRKGHEGDKATWDGMANKAGEERVRNYDPKKEAELDSLRRMAEEGIAKINRYLESHQAPISEDPLLKEVTTHFGLLEFTRDRLQGQINQINLGADWAEGGIDNGAHHPKKVIPYEVGDIDGIINKIEQLESLAEKSSNK